jgi:hypothetical protein
MEDIERAMSKCHDEDGTANAQTLRDLSAAHSRLFEVWCILTGTQKPGVRRAKSGRAQPPGPAAPLEPQEAQKPQAIDNQPILI